MSPKSTAKNGRTPKTEGAPQAKNAFGDDRLPGGSMSGKVFGNSHAVLQAVMD